MRATLLSQWLRECKENHPQCSKVVLSGLPSRLLKIDDDPYGGSVRLEMYEEGPHFPEYVTLSHCWGTQAHPIRMTSDNIDRFRQSVLTSELPATFRDAAAVVRSIGLHHLWIDSLCIVQNDLLDWQTESAKMGSIYENSVLTIAASSATDATEGCTLDLEEIATQHRGWVLQEMILSRRILHFTKQQVYWQCRELAESEDGCLHEATSVDEAKQSSRIMLRQNTTFTSDIRRLWWVWCMDYSRRLFTVPADRLYACAGITQYYNHLHGEEAVVLGLRRDRLLSELLWLLVNHRAAPRIAAAGLPSWTWLSRQ
ncbi:HET-domain-containing protein, partial [Byssothecium circinans]